MECFWSIFNYDDYNIVQSWNMTTHHEVYISDYVLVELEENLLENENIDISADSLTTIARDIWFKIIVSHTRINLDIPLLVHDGNDLQILQDAVDVSADFLITRNLKDFDIDLIYKYFAIAVVDSIPRELLI